MGEAGQSGFVDARAEAICSQVDRITEDERFKHSRALCRFLRYTVEETLVGRGSGLKENVLGREVFDRGTDFDPRLDPIVRVQASRLRQRLRSFYQAQGHGERLRIEYPKGSYAPVFEDRNGEAAAGEDRQRRGSGSTRTRGRWLAVAVVTSLTAVIAAIWVSFGPNDRTFTTVSQAVRLTANTGVTIFPAISSDGKLLAYCSDRRSGKLELWLQPVAGGDPELLSTGAGAALTPDFSPDGTRVVFRSNRENGGLYTVSVFGKDERRLAESGWRPRYSPNGKWIVYQGPGRKPGGALYVIPAEGGQARLVETSGIQLGGEPIWTPDNRNLLFAGFEAGRVADWWVVPASGGRAHTTGMAAQLRRQDLGELSVETAPGGWLGNEMFFALVGEEMANLWHVPFSPSNWTVRGQIRQSTSGSAMELSPRVSSTNRIVFSSDSHATHLWSLHTAKQGGELEQLTQDRSLAPGHFRNPFRFSAAGDLVVFSSRRGGNPDIWVRNVTTGEEHALVSTATSEVDPLLSGDGRTLAYRVLGHGPPAINLLDIREGRQRQFTAGCDAIYSWLPGGDGLLCGVRTGPRHSLAVVKRDGKIALWDQGVNHSFVHAAVSPNGLWLAATMWDLDASRLELWVAPFKTGHPASASDWTRIPAREPNGPIVWASASDRIFYFGEEDGNRCIWAVTWNRGHASSRQAIRHFHSTRAYPWNSWLAISGDRLVFALTESNSNIWSIQFSDRAAKGWLKGLYDLSSRF